MRGDNDETSETHYSDLRNPYPGRLGVIEEGAYADLLLVDRQSAPGHLDPDEARREHLSEGAKTMRLAVMGPADLAGDVSAQFTPTEPYEFLRP